MPGGARAVAASPQPVTVYRPIQRIEWEGIYTSPDGIAYFALEPTSADNYWSYESQLSSARTLGDRAAEVDALLHLGLGKQLGRYFYDEAVDYYEQGLAVAEDLTTDPIPKILLLGNISLTYLQSGYFYSEPLEYLQQLYALTWHKAYYYSGTDPKWAELALGNIGKLYFGSAHYALAIDTHLQRLALARELGDTAGEATALNDLAMVYQALGDQSKAIEYNQQQLSLARSHQNLRGVAQALSNLGISYHSSGDYAKAIDYQQQLLQLGQAQKNALWQEQALANLAGAYYFQGQYDQALDLYRQAIQVAEQVGETQMVRTIRNNQGLVYQRQGDVAASISLYNQALNAAIYQDDSQAKAIAWNNLGSAFATNGQSDQAINALSQSIAQLETARQRLGGNDSYTISLFDTQRVPYQNLQALLLDQAKPEEALVVAERGRARAFVELLNRRLQASTTQAPVTPALTQADIQRIVRSHQATLVEYSILSEEMDQTEHQTRLAIWVVQPSGEIAARVVPLPDAVRTTANPVQSWVAQSRDGLGVRGLAIATRPIAQTGSVRSTETNLRALNQVLIEPIADLLPTDPEATVIIVPQAELFLIPFAALQASDGSTLIDHHTLAILPSIQVLDFATQATASQEPLFSGSATALVVGNPSMPSVAPALGAQPQALPPLPGTQVEATNIATVLHTQALTGAQATEAAIKSRLPTAPWVHLATHGLLDDVDGLNSAIALTPASPDDGLLTAAEVLDLKLRANLVVLSACDTGRGRITGDGVIGLSRSFMAAGVPSLLVSLWQVPDQSTADLMVAFYQALSTGESKAQALRTAMLKTRDTYPNPLAWAGFTLVGEPG